MWTFFGGFRVKYAEICGNLRKSVEICVSKSLWKSVEICENLQGVSFRRIRIRMWYFCVFLSTFDPSKSLCLTHNWGVWVMAAGIYGVLLKVSINSVILRVMCYYVLVCLWD